MKTFPRKRPSDDDAIEARAAAWLAQRDAGLTDAEQREFDRWRAANPRHAAAVARLEAAWSALLQLRNYRPTARAHPDRDILAPRRFARPTPFLRPLLAAAAVAFLALGAWQWSRVAAPPAPTTELYSTTVGGYERVTLSDGSVLQLNDHTEVRVDFTDAERRLHLLRGQAHFTVAKNKARPFVVTTASVAVRAVGTAFDIRVGHSEVEVLVTEGVVQLDRASPDARLADRASTPPSLVAAGWRAMVPHDTTAPSNLEPIDAAGVREALSWQGPRLVFVETPLSEVIAQFNRRNRTQISLADPSLADLPVGGSFRADNVEAFVRLLASSGDISFELVGDRFVLRKAR